MSFSEEAADNLALIDPKFIVDWVGEIINPPLIGNETKIFKTSNGRPMHLYFRNGPLLIRLLLYPLGEKAADLNLAYNELTRVDRLIGSKVQHCVQWSQELPN